VASASIPVTPTVTEELFNGSGGGEPDASPAPTSASEPAPPTPKGPELLPVTGANAGESGRLVLVLATALLGVLLVVTGLALYIQH